MNITKEQIAEWLNNKGIRGVRDDDLVDIMRQCLSDLAPKWVSVDDRLPRDYECVLAMTVHGEYELVMLNDKGFFEKISDDDYFLSEFITRWMPLPK